jgi:hypothetical protein
MAISLWKYASAIFASSRSVAQCFRSKVMDVTSLRLILVGDLATAAGLTNGSAQKYENGVAA